MLTSLAIPTSCVTDIWVWSTGTATGVQLGNLYDSSCWPGSRDLATTISPAICPAGYTSACNASPSKDASETVWACCPTGFSCDGGFFSCLSGGKETKTYVVTGRDRAGNTLTSTLATESGINAHSIRVAFHSSDLFVSSTSTTSSSSTSSTSSSQFPTSTSSSGSGDLSVGAKTGIGIGVGLGGLLLFSLLGWLAWRRHRNKRLANGQDPSVRQQSYVGTTQYPKANPVTPTTKMNVTNNVPGIHELGTEPYAELPAEIPTSNRRDG
ncbi:uncharacterized protein F4812DRAFT_413842 [Daldinia caldariorum]|uniref:uncharacterized protein n=1 Tax=Daldinia caldariorum TaxID=326644 RepID=UPI002008E6AD|nr:uncharacterized protein F4812DRAFT_413842 [Daldinia caldariorum]KAI1471382.1 hypothetical protein F4812DRAFT_413842 [Daldinia caldariorum]